MSIELERAPDAITSDADCEVSESGSVVTSSTVDRINRRHRQIMEFGKRALEEAIDIGRELSDAKSSLEHGEWLPWVEDNLEFTTRTAQRYISVWDNRDQLKNDS